MTSVNVDSALATQINIDNMSWNLAKGEMEISILKAEVMIKFKI